MSISQRIRVSFFAFAAIAVPAMSVQAGEEWHFVVKNATGSNIVKLEVSEDNSTWGNFAIGKGIGPGATATLVWAESTNNEGCEQWIRAKFADGSYSGASQQDFCKDLDTPIEFTE